MPTTSDSRQVGRGRAKIERLEIELLRSLTVDASIRQYPALQAEFEPRLLADAQRRLLYQPQALPQRRLSLLRLSAQLRAHRAARLSRLRWCPQS